MEDGSACCWIAGIVLIMLLVGGIITANNKSKELMRVKQHYLDSLNALKRNPNSSEIRQRTLSFGRAYASSAKNSSGTTVFDEVALKNDIDAACAGAVVAKREIAMPSKGKTSSVEERLMHLDSLKAKDLINYDEYVERRNQILSDL